MPACQPGDFGVVRIRNPAGRVIHWMENLSGGHGDWEHAILATEPGYIVEATPAGVVYTEFHYDPDLVYWSSGKIPLTPYQRTSICAAAEMLPGTTPYSYLDYLAIAAHSWHIPAPGLRSYIASTGHMICSQVIDSCYQAAGVQLFTDGRWAGYVRPVDLAARIGAP